MAIEISAADHIDQLLRLRPGHRVTELRGALPEVREATQAAFDALFETPPPDGLTPGDRERSALRVAALLGEEGLVAFHRARQRGAATPGLRAAAIESFVDRLTMRPATVRGQQLRDLQALGLPSVAIVTLAQLVGFQSHLARLLIGLRAMAAAGLSAVQVPPDDSPRAGRNPVSAAPPVGRFTAAPMDWLPRLPTVDPARASAAQRGALADAQAALASTPLNRVLVHAPDLLLARSRLQHAVMAGPGALGRAERELTATAVARLSGCLLDASIHARAFGPLSKAPQVADRLLAEGVNAPLAPRWRVLVDLAAALAANPPALRSSHVSVAYAAGLGNAQVLHAVHVAALGVWADRLTLALGEAHSAPG